MGLDMRLYRCKHDNEQHDEEIGYWSKFNDLHLYIAKMKPNYEDCKATPLSLEELTHLRDVMIEVQNKLNSRTNDWKANMIIYDEIYKLLPPACIPPTHPEGSEKWFEADVADSVAILKYAVELAEKGEKIYYHAWRYGECDKDIAEKLKALGYEYNPERTHYQKEIDGPYYNRVAIGKDNTCICKLWCSATNLTSECTIERLEKIIATIEADKKQIEQLLAVKK